MTKKKKNYPITQANTGMIRRKPTEREMTANRSLIANTHEMLGSLLGRMQHSATLGMSYGADNNDRDLYKVLGYRKNVYFEHYYNYFKRDPIGRVLLKKLPEAVWKSNPKISEVDDTIKDSKLVEEYSALEKRLKINSKMLRLDVLRGLGNYGVLLMGFSDSDVFEEPVTPSNNLQLQYIHPYSQNSCAIVKFDSNRMSERYGLPELYEIKIGGTGDYAIQDAKSNSQSIRVHWTRVIHAVKNPLETDVYGPPELEEVYNNVQNIEKIAGGSGEMFWRGARPGYVAKAQKDAIIENLDADDLQEQMNEYDHNLRRWLNLQGMDVEPLAIQVVSPKEHVDCQVELICMAKGYPKRIFMGSERGELASSQDLNTWNELVYQCMTNHAEPNMIRPFIDRLIEYGVLTAPSSKDGEYMVDWPELSVIGEKERAEINNIKVKTFAEYLKSPGAELLIPQEIFLERLMEFSKDEILEILGILKEFKSLEEDDDKEFINGSKGSDTE